MTRNLQDSSLELIMETPLLSLPTKPSRGRGWRGVLQLWENLSWSKAKLQQIPWILVQRVCLEQTGTIFAWCYLWL